MVDVRRLLLLAVATFIVGCGSSADHAAPGTSVAPNAAADGTDPGSSPDSIVCTTFVSRGASEHIARVTLPAGTVDVGAQVDADLVADASSIGIQGDYLVTCANTAVRIGLADGKAEVSDVPCDAVTADASTIWVVAQGKIAQYTDFDALKAHQPSGSAALDEHAVNRIAPGGDGTLIGSAFQTDSVVHVTPSTGVTSAPLKLDSFSGMVLGVSALADGRVVLASWSLGGGLYVFDGTSGAKIHSSEQATSNQLFHGLACSTH
jgi:hypothetical protein